MVISPDTNWPRITVITPSFNQGQFLAETIDSVLSQGYPNLEYFVIDGGSTDNSVNIIRTNSARLNWWVSEPDRGQADAINKGFKRATGRLVGWINSDDLLLPGSLKLLAEANKENPDKVIAGDVINIKYSNKQDKSWIPDGLIHQRDLTFQNFIQFWNRKMIWHQPGIYFPGRAIKEIGFLDEALRYGFDHELMCRLLQNFPVHYLNKPIAKFRIHPTSKSSKEGYRFSFEIEEVSRRYWKDMPGADDKDFTRHLAVWNLRYGLRLILSKKTGGFHLLWHAFQMTLRGVVGLVDKHFS